MKKPDFIDTCEFSEQELKQLMNLALTLKACARADYYPPLLKNRVLALVLDRPDSLLTAHCAAAMEQLGGRLIPLEIKVEPGNAKLAAKRIASFADCAALCADRHESLLALAKYAAFPVLNCGSTVCTPLTEVGDLVTMFEHLPREKRLEECKLVYDGAATAECASALFMTSKMGLEFAQAAESPEQLKPQVTKIAERQNKKSGGSFTLTSNGAEAYRNADFLKTGPEGAVHAPSVDRPLTLLDPLENRMSVLRAVLLYLMYADPMQRDQLLIEKMRRTLAARLHEVFGFGEAT